MPIKSTKTRKRSIDYSYIPCGKPRFHYDDSCHFFQYYNTSCDIVKYLSNDIIRQLLTDECSITSLPELNSNRYSRLICNVDEWLAKQTKKATKEEFYDFINSNLDDIE